MEVNLPDRVRILENRDRRRDRRINDQKHEIERLRSALQAFITQGDGPASEGEQARADIDLTRGETASSRSSHTRPSSHSQDARGTEDGSTSDDVTEEINTPIWDPQDEVYRCALCAWEVVDYYCQGCSAEHDYSSDVLLPMPYNSVTTNDEALNSDRRLAPRGTTPTLEIGNIPLPRLPVYRSGTRATEEYRRLLEHGATPLMCETFLLQYDPNKGIIAWADDDLFELFSGPKMERGHQWKIYLGRRIELDPEDLDGSQFIEDLLEDVLYYPIESAFSNRAHERWETTVESPGIWATKPIVEADGNDQQSTDGKSESGESDDDDSQADSDHEWDQLVEAENKALDEGPSDEITAIRPDEYEPSEVGSDTYDEQPVWYLNRQGTDIGLDEDMDLEDSPRVVAQELGSEDIEIVTQNPGLEEETLEDDSADSDFDDDEVLSGDEVVSVLRRA